HPLLISPFVPPLHEVERGKGGDVVPFDLVLAPDEFTVLISGPNTGGKTVLIKAVGLLCLMAQSGIVPPIGPQSTLPVFDGVFADIGDRQSIAASLSTFSAHVAVLKDILERAESGSLVLLDEIGSGTDPAEGAALAAAVLKTLTRRRAVTLATTHLGALKQLATETVGIVNASLQFDAETLTPTFRLLKGVPGRSYSRPGGRSKRRWAGRGRRWTRRRPKRRADSSNKRLTRRMYGKREKPGKRERGKGKRGFRWRSSSPVGRSRRVPRDGRRARRGRRPERGTRRRRRRRRSHSGACGRTKPKPD